MKLKVTKLDPAARIPVKQAYKSHNQLGIDFFALETVKIMPKENAIIRTGVAVQLDQPGFGIVLKDKSGIAVKRGLRCAAGVIDNDYTGEILAILYNTSDQPQKIYAGEQCIQGIVTQIFDVTIEEVEVLAETDRGNKGFGSSYMKDDAKTAAAVIGKKIKVDAIPAKQVTAFEVVDAVAAEANVDSLSQPEPIEEPKLDTEHSPETIDANFEEIPEVAPAAEKVVEEVPAKKPNKFTKKK